MALRIDPDPADQPVHCRHEPPDETPSLISGLLNAAADIGLQAGLEVMEEGAELAVEAVGEVISGIFDFLTG